MKPTDVLTHGTTSGYRHGCRCNQCKEAKSIDYAIYKRRKKNGGEPIVVEEGPSPNLLGFMGLPPDQVELMVDIAFWLVYHEGVDLPDATMRARREVMDLD